MNENWKLSSSSETAAYFLVRYLAQTIFPYNTLIGRDESFYILTPHPAKSNCEDQIVPHKLYFS